MVLCLLPPRKKDIRARQSRRQAEEKRIELAKKRRRKEIFAGSPMTFEEASDFLSDQEEDVHPIPAGAEIVTVVEGTLTFYTKKELIEEAEELFKACYEGEDDEEPPQVTDTEGHDR